MKNTALTNLINRINRINRLKAAREAATNDADRIRLAVMIAELNCFE